MQRQSLLYLSPKSTFYNSKSEVIINNKLVHTELFEEDRTLYTLLLYFNESKYYSKSLIIENLLKNSLYKENKDSEMIIIEDYLINKALMNENITHALKLLLMLKKSRINNARTSKVILRFLFERGNTDYISIKYKSKIKDLLVHAIGFNNIKKMLNGDDLLFNKFIGRYNNPYSKEVFFFVFDKVYTYKSEYITEYLRAKDMFRTGNSLVKIKKNILPVEVLEGFNSFYNRNFSLSTIYETANISDKQKIQRVKIMEKESIKLEKVIDYNKYEIPELYKLIYNGNLTKEDSEKCLDIITLKSRELKSFYLKNLSFNMSETAVILDCSESMIGGKDSKLNAFYNSLALKDILGTEAIYYCGGNLENGLIIPSGETNLCFSLIDAVKNNHKNIIIISDGFENVGNISAIYERLNKLYPELNLIHLNPVFSPKDMEFKDLGYNIPTIPISNYKDLNNFELFYLLNTDIKLFKSKILEVIKTEIKGCE